MSLSVDLFAAHSMINPHPMLAALREKAPVHRVEPQGWWAVSRYEDVMFVLKNPEIFSSETGLERMRPPHVDEATWEEVMVLRAKNLVNADPPDHTRLRKLVSGAFTPRAIAQLEVRVRQISSELIDGVLARDEFDVVEDLAIPLPVTVIAEMLGIEPSRRHDFKRWSDDLMEVSLITRARGTSDRIEELIQSRRELITHFEELVAERRANPREDLISDLVRAETEEGKLSAEEVLTMAVLLLIAGNETTTNLIATGTHLLLEHPEALAALRADPSLIPGFIEEVLRYEGPVMMLFRMAKQDVTLSGVTLPEGSILLPVVSAANRDPAQFPDPDRFDIRRESRGHLAFGFGIHFCVGAPLSRVEGRILFEDMLRRLPPFSRTSAQPDWRANNSLRGLGSLRVRFDRAAARAQASQLQP